MKRLLLFLGILAVLSPAAMGENPKGPQDGTGYPVNYSFTRREIRDFETVLNNTLNATFSANPWALWQKTRGAYLQGYGITFNFLVNIHLAFINTPFGVAKGVEITPGQKRRQIDELKEKLTRVLMEYGDKFGQLKATEVVTIVAFFEDRNFPDEENQNKTVVMSIQKKDLDELARKEARWNEFKQRVKIVEY